MKKWLVLSALIVCSVAVARVDQSNVGKKLPMLSVDYVSNAPVATAGKPMLVEFWATWCPPCRQSIPHVNEIYKNYKDRGLVVVGISDEPKSKISTFMKTLPMNYSVASDPGGKFSQQFGISGIPHAFLVNTSGEIVWEGHPMSLQAIDIEKIMGSPGASASPVPAGATAAPAAPVFTPPPNGKKFY